MKKVLKFTEYLNENKLNEDNLTDMGFVGYGYDASGAGPRDNSVSIGGQSQQMNDLRQQYIRLQNILANVFNTSLDAGAKSIFDFEILNLRIVRIFPNSSNSLDVYIKFEMEDSLYYGCFKNWASVSGTQLVSSVLDLPQISRHLENKIKFEGVLKNALVEWFRPKPGPYIALKEVKVYDNMGNIFYIPENGKIEVDEVLSEEDKPIIYLTYSDKKLFFTDLDYYYFHWWFSKRENKPFYL